VGVKRLNLDRFEAFTEGLAEPVAPDLGALDTWLASLSRAPV